jgi:hypothetical protein
MGVKLRASKTKRFGDMKFSRHRWTALGLFGELSLAPLVVLNTLTECWLLNMVAYETGPGATQADSFAVSSYLSFVALLANRRKDVRELRAMGIINSAMSDDRGNTRLLQVAGAVPSRRRANDTSTYPK